MDDYGEQYGREEAGLPRATQVRPALVCHCDACGRVCRVLSALEGVLGYGADRLEGLLISELLAPGPGRDALPSFLTYLSAERPEPEPFAARALTADGRILDVELHWQPIGDQDSGVSDFVCTVLDVTQHHAQARVERALADLLRSAANSIGGALWVVDSDLRIVYISDAALEWCRGLGLEVSNAEGRLLRQVFPFLDPSVFAEYQTVFSSGRPLCTSEKILVNGRAVATETRKHPIMTDGAVRQVVTIIEDVTDREIALDHVVAQRDLAQRLLDATTVDEALEAAADTATRVATADAVGIYVTEASSTDAWRLACHVGLPEALINQAACVPEQPFWLETVEARVPSFARVSDLPPQGGGLGLCGRVPHDWRRSCVRRARVGGRVCCSVAVGGASVSCAAGPAGRLVVTARERPGTPESVGAATSERRAPAAHIRRAGPGPMGPGCGNR